MIGLEADLAMKKPARGGLVAGRRAAYLKRGSGTVMTWPGSEPT